MKEFNCTGCDYSCSEWCGRKKCEIVIDKD